MTSLIGLDEEGVRRVLGEELARIAVRKGGAGCSCCAPCSKNSVRLRFRSSKYPERLLAVAADELLALRRELQRFRNARPELAAIRDQALALVDAGHLDAALVRRSIAGAR